MKRLLYSLIAIAVIVAISPLNVYAAGWAYEQNFDLLTPGTLTGQDSWALGQGTVEVATDQYDTPGQSVKINGGSGNPYRTRDITDVTTDDSTMYVSLRVDSVASNNNPAFILFRHSNGTANVGSVYLNFPAAGNISIRQGGGAESFTVVGSITANTWVRVGVRFDFTNDEMVLNVDDGTWSSPVSTATSFAEVDQFWFSVSSGAGAYNYYFDSVSTTYATSSPAASVSTPSDVIRF